jgi:hypothetical protein
MALFNFKKKDNVLDLTEKYKKQLEAKTNAESNLETTPSQSESSGLNFFGSMASSVKEAGPSEENIEVLGDGDRKRKLAKRLIDMTSKIEDLSNQIYHLQQRLEVLERKSGIRIE